MLASFFFFTGIKSHAQYFEFIENKGQWNGRVKFQTDMKGGALFLQPGGYKVMLHNLDDLGKINEYFGAHHINNKDSSAKPAGSKTEALKNFILHSHAYEVNFLGANLNAASSPLPPRKVLPITLFISGDVFITTPSCPPPIALR